MTNGEKTDGGIDERTVEVLLVKYRSRADIFPEDSKTYRALHSAADELEDALHD